MPSADWVAFQESFLGEPRRAWNEGVDARALLALTGEERAAAEQLLLEGLEDDRCVEGLGYLRSLAALPRLHEMLPRSRSWVRVKVAEAIWRISTAEQALGVLLEMLSSASDEYDRLYALQALEGIVSPKARPALLDALTDSSLMIRTGALDALFRQAGYTAYDVPETAGIRPLLMSADPEEHRKAQQSMRQLFFDNRQEGSIEG